MISSAELCQWGGNAGCDMRPGGLTDESTHSHTRARTHTQMHRGPFIKGWQGTIGQPGNQNTGPGMCVCVCVCTRACWDVRERVHM